MPVGIPSSPDRVRQLAFAVLAIALPLAIAVASLSAQDSNALARRSADARVQTEETRFLSQAERITADESRARTAATNSELGAIRALMSRLPREEQAQITQEADSLFPGSNRAAS